MDDERFLAAQALEAAFEAIKAKHKNLHARYASTSDPLLLELADMILLFSAQLTLAAGAPGTGKLAVESEKTKRRIKYSIH